MLTKVLKASLSSTLGIGTSSTVLPLRFALSIPIVEEHHWGEPGLPFRARRRARNGKPGSPRGERSTSPFLDRPSVVCHNRRMDARFSLFAMALAGALLVCCVSRAAAADEPELGRAIFREQVRPLLTTKCLACHGGD